MAKEWTYGVTPDAVDADLDDLRIIARKGDGSTIFVPAAPIIARAVADSLAEFGISGVGGLIDGRYVIEVTNGVAGYALVDAVDQDPYFPSVELAPPTMTTPTVITLPDVAYEQDWPTFNDAPAGKVYRYEATAGEDVVFRFTGTTPLAYPLLCTGGRHARYVGLEFEIVTQAGGGIGEINDNARAHFPQTACIHDNNSGEMFVEGCLLDLTGHAGDCIVIRNDQLTDGEARAQRHVTIKNCHFRGFSGDANVHGDIFQTQGETMGNLSVENLTVYSAQEGFVVELGLGCDHFLIRNFDFHKDTDYTPYLDVYGSPAFVLCETWEPTNCWVSADFETDYFYINTTGTYITHGPSGAVANANITVGSPAVEFAPANKVGRNYTSPHD